MEDLLGPYEVVKEFDPTHDCVVIDVRRPGAVPRFRSSVKLSLDQAERFIVALERLVRG